MKQVQLVPRLQGRRRHGAVGQPASLRGLAPAAARRARPAGARAALPRGQARRAAASQRGLCRGADSTAGALRWAGFIIVVGAGGNKAQQRRLNKCPVALAAPVSSPVELGSCKACFPRRLPRHASLCPLESRTPLSTPQVEGWMLHWYWLRRATGTAGTKGDACGGGRGRPRRPPKSN